MLTREHANPHYPEQVPVTTTTVDYGALAEGLQRQFRAIPATDRVRLAKRTSNLFRARDGAPVAGLDVAALDGVLSIDREARTADVLGMTTYEHLTAATLLGVSFVVHQMGSVVGAWGGGMIFDTFGNYDLAWRFGVSMGIAAGLVQILFGGPSGTWSRLRTMRAAH